MYLRLSEYQSSKLSEQGLTTLQEENVVTFLFSWINLLRLLGQFWHDLSYKSQMNLMGLSACK